MNPRCLTRVRFALIGVVVWGAAGQAHGHVRVIAPNGGEKLDVGSVYTITWKIVIKHDLLNWDLWYSTTGPNGQWMVIVANLPPGDREVGSVHTYKWTVPDTVSNRVRVRIRMDNRGQDYEDVSNANFAIQRPIPGDMNCDGSVDLVDVGPFISALLDPDEYANEYPDCYIGRADINEDGSVDLTDVEPFIKLLIGP